MHLQKMVHVVGVVWCVYVVVVLVGVTPLAFHYKKTKQKKLNKYTLVFVNRIHNIYIPFLVNNKKLKFHKIQGVCGLY